MGKRLQVLLEEGEFRSLREAAQRQGVPVSEWVRAALRTAHRQEGGAGLDAKIRAVRAATRHEFPTGDIDAMLAEIELSYAAPAPGRE